MPHHFYRSLLSKVEYSHCLLNEFWFIFITTVCVIIYDQVITGIYGASGMVPYALRSLTLLQSSGVFTIHLFSKPPNPNHD